MDLGLPRAFAFALAETFGSAFLLARDFAFGDARVLAAAFAFGILAGCDSTCSGVSCATFAFLVLRVLILLSHEDPVGPVAAVASASAPASCSASFIASLAFLFLGLGLRARRVFNLRLWVFFAFREFPPLFLHFLPSFPFPFPFAFPRLALVTAFIRSWSSLVTYGRLPPSPAAESGLATLSVSVLGGA